MDERNRSRLSFLLAALVILGSFGALYLQRCTWDQALTGVLLALAAVGLYHAPAPGQALKTALPLLAVLIMGCEYNGRWALHVSQSVPIQADQINLTPQAPGGVVCPAGKACLTASSSTGRIYAIDSSGVGLDVGTVKGYRVLSSAPSGSAGDVYYDSTLGTFRHYTNTWTSAWSGADVSGQAATAITAGTAAYLVAPGIAAGSATAVPLLTLPHAGTVRNLYCSADTLPGGGESLACVVWRRVGGSGSLSTTGVGCTIGGTGKCSDTSTTQAQAAGANLYILCTQSAASAAAGVNCGFQVSP